MLLTGTPLQNKISELWNLLNFASPKDFPEENSFVKTYGDMNDFQQVGIGIEIFE